MALSIAGTESYQGIFKPFAQRLDLRRAVANWRVHHGSFRYVHPDENAHPESRALARPTPRPINSEKTSPGTETAQTSFFEQSLIDFIHASDLELKSMQAQASVDNPDMQMLAFTLHSPYPHSVDQFYLLRDQKEQFHVAHRVARENDNYLDATFFGNIPLPVKKDDRWLTYAAGKSHVYVREVSSNEFSLGEQKLMQIAFSRLPTVYYLNHPGEVAKWRKPQRPNSSLLLSDGDPSGVFDLLHHPSDDLPSEAAGPDDRFSARSLLDEDAIPQWLQLLMTGDTLSPESPDAAFPQTDRFHLSTTGHPADTIANVVPPQLSSPEPLLEIPPELARIFGPSKNSDSEDNDRGFRWQQEPALAEAALAYVKHPTTPPQHHTLNISQALLQQRGIPTSFPSNSNGWESYPQGGDVTPDFSFAHKSTSSLDSYERLEFRDGARHVISYKKPGTTDRYIGLPARELVDTDEMDSDGKTIRDILQERLVRDGARVTHPLPSPPLYQEISTPRQNPMAADVQQRQSPANQLTGQRVARTHDRQPHIPIASPIILFPRDASDGDHDLALHEQPAFVATYAQRVGTASRTLGELYGISRPRRIERIGKIETV